jgi:hypothetical protein
LLTDHFSPVDSHFRWPINWHNMEVGSDAWELSIHLSLASVTVSQTRQIIFWVTTLVNAHVSIELLIMSGAHLPSGPEEISCIIVSEWLDGFQSEPDRHSFESSEESKLSRLWFSTWDCANKVNS